MRGPAVVGIPLASLSISVVALRLLLKAAETTLKSGAVWALDSIGGTEQPHSHRRTNCPLPPEFHDDSIEVPIVPSNCSPLVSLHSFSSPGDGAPDRALPISVRLWHDGQPEAMQTWPYPSTLGSATGTTSLRSFKGHVSQDSNWLRGLAKVPSFVNASSEYVDAQMTVASDHTSSLVQVFANMAPCTRLHASIGKELRQACPAWSESVYAEGMEMFSSQDFEAMKLEYTSTAGHSETTGRDDRPAVKNSGNGRDTEGTRTDSIYERVALLCVDFDDTLTDGDTTHLLIEVAGEQQVTPAGKEEIAREWERLTHAFVTDYNELVEEVLKTQTREVANTATTRGQVDRAGLEEFLRRLEEIDLDSVARVSASQVFRGITRESVQVALAGPLRSRWKARPGVDLCLSRALASPFVMHVVSINWSRDAITTILAEAVSSVHGTNPESEKIVPSAAAERHGSWHGQDEAIPISSNDLVYDGDGVSTGEVAISIPGASGKQQRFLDLAKVARETASRSEYEDKSKQRSLTIFVGDSVTDLLAMLDADVGVVVGDSRTFERVAIAFGIPVCPLAFAHEAVEWASREEKHTHIPGGPTPCIYRASGWSEINAFLFGGE